MNPFRLPPAYVVILSGIVAAMHIGKMPTAIPLLRDALGITLVQGGFLLSMVQMAGMLVGVFAGLTADGIGLRRSVIAGQCIFALASLGGIWVGQAEHLLLLRAFEGLGFLLAVLPVPSLIRQLVSPERLALHLGFWGTYMATGTAIALFGGPLLMGLTGWQGLWGLLAVVSALMALWVWLQVPSERQRLGALSAATNPVPTESALARLRLTLTSAGPWRIAIVFSMYSSQWLAVIGFLPSVYAQAGLSSQTAGALTALASLVNVTGSIAAGRLLHRGVCSRHLLYLGFISMTLTAFLAFGPLTADAPVLRYLAVLLFSAIGGVIPGTLFSLAVHVAPNARTVSTTVGWMQQCSSAGQFLGPPLVAWVAGLAGGWQWTWTMTGAASLVGLLIASGVTLRRPDPMP